MRRPPFRTTLPPFLDYPYRRKLEKTNPCFPQYVEHPRLHDQLWGSERTSRERFAQSSIPESLVCPIHVRDGILGDGVGFIREFEPVGIHEEPAAMAHTTRSLCLDSFGRLVH